MSQAHFARIWKRPAAEQADVADSVMRRAKWSGGNKRLFSIKQAGDAVNLCCLNRFFERERWNDGRDAFGQHRFTRARRADHQDVVTTSDSYLDRSLHVSLAFYVAKIDVVTLMRGEKFAQISARGKQGNFAAQKRECLPQILHTIDVDLIHRRCFEGV